MADITPAANDVVAEASSPPVMAASSPGHFLELRLSSTRGASGEENVTAQLEQPGDATWQIKMAAMEETADSVVQRKRITSVVLYAEAEALREEDKSAVRRLEAKVAELQRQLEASAQGEKAVRQQLDDQQSTIATLQQRLDSLETRSKPTTPAPPLPIPPAPPRSLTNGERRALSEKFIEAAKQGRVGEMRQLFDQGADTRQKDRHGRLGMYWAAAYGHLDAVRLLISLGVPVDNVDNYGQMPVHTAGYYNRADCLKALVGAGADIDARGTNDGETALHAAARQGNEESVRVLMELGANPNVRDNAGQLPRDVTASAAIRALLSRT